MRRDTKFPLIQTWPLTRIVQPGIEASFKQRTQWRIERDFAGKTYRQGDIHAPIVLLADTVAPDTTTLARPPLTASSIHFALTALREVNRPADEQGWKAFAGRERIAWKTGTSVGHRDAWAVGVSDRWCVAVWTGNATGEGRPGLTGTLAAAPLMLDLFGPLGKGHGFDPPYDEMIRAPICPLLLDDELELDNYEANFRRMFGNPRMDAVLGSVDGRCASTA